MTDGSLPLGTLHLNQHGIGAVHAGARHQADIVLVGHGMWYGLKEKGIVTRLYINKIVTGEYEAV